jgi:hypothetical protein
VGKLSKQLQGLDLIINDLENAEENFTKYVFHNNIDGKCVFCAGGVLLKRSGVIFGPIYNINDLGLYESQADKRYGLDLFRSRFWYNPSIQCHKCDCELGHLGVVITHMNDVHSSSHKETAQLLRELSKLYNLETGEKLGE